MKKFAGLLPIGAGFDLRDHVDSNSCVFVRSQIRSAFDALIEIDNAFDRRAILDVAADARKAHK